MPTKSKWSSNFLSPKNDILRKCEIHPACLSRVEIFVQFLESPLPPVFPAHFVDALLPFDPWITSVLQNFLRIAVCILATKLTSLHWCCIWVSSNANSSTRSPLSSDSCSGSVMWLPSDWLSFVRISMVTSLGQSAFLMLPTRIRWL